ncbi:MAG: deoxyribodipyrimidine photo-lyase [Armatimonadota bacterium]|nr:DNA photolyase family protein [bacterium]MDW8321306.1 deoxyribodipyrimidine photo-lyase [Armatimonadota bacterium]
MRRVAIFRRELRLTDNPLLEDAEQGEWIPVFFLDEYNQQEHGDNLRALFFYALRHLQRRIESSGGKLYVVPLEQQEQFFDIACPDEVLFCEDVEPHSRERDSVLRSLLQRRGIRYRVLQDSLLSPIPESTYPSFTQFYKKHFTLHVEPEPPIPAPSYLRTPELDVPTAAIPAVDTEPAGQWYATEEEVQAKWQRFVATTLPRYQSLRNLPAVEGVSRMSPYIRCGMISLRQMLREAWGVSEQFVKELAWRDFYSHLLHHYPETVNMELRPEWRGFPWRHDEERFERWAKGQTGIPLVDAGMRQLLREGWMHNRTRMVVASYLTKHLLIDWRWGERWFYLHLVDADLAQNVGNWQWATGCGADALPYFRIFNPMLQAQKFDPNAEYIRRYVPELRRATGEQLNDLQNLHHAFPEYPPPIVTPEEGRKRFLQAAQRFFGESAQEKLPFDHEYEA